MSQRLHIGKTSEAYFDCVLEDENGAREKLLKDWMGSGAGLLLGGWKIRIGDLALWRRLEPQIEGIFSEIGEQYPEAISAFYRGDRSIENPTADQLRAWLENEP